jgi:hypothetical protein
VNYIESHLLPLLGKGMDDPGVSRAISDLGLVDTYEPDPLTRYVGSDKRGIHLCFDNSRLVDIQIHVQPTEDYSAFADALPFGIQKGMSQDEIHKLLGEPYEFDKFDSRYLMENGRARLLVAYDDSLLVKYLSIAPKELWL